MTALIMQLSHQTSPVLTRQRGDQAVSNICIDGEMGVDERHLAETPKPVISSQIKKLRCVY
jgi:hypothetical protein